MAQANRSRVILLFGLAESGIDAVGQAIHAAGIPLAADASAAGRGFAVSASLDAVASRIASELGLPAEIGGPLVVSAQSPAASRRRIDRATDEYLVRASAEIAALLPSHLSTPILLAAGRIGALPRFWLRAFARAGVDVQPVLLARNPLAVAQLTRASGGPPPRETVFHWHHLALDVLGADPAHVAVLPSPTADLSVLGLAGRGDAPPHPKDLADLTHVPLMSDQTRDLHRLLGDWATLTPGARTTAVAALRNRFDDAVTLTAAARVVTLGERNLRVMPDRPAPQPAASPLLVHFHIFKNAGTSVDKMLRRNFGAGWGEEEFTGGTLAERQHRFRDYLAGRGDLSAFSSHTAQLPAPDLPGRTVVPIVFVRHPLLRIRSAYRFERQQDAQTRGAILAKSTDLAGYVTALLQEPKMRHARNFQVFRFAAGTPGPAAQDLRRALETAARLPFVGLVEAYDRSIDRLAELIRPLFPDFQPVTLHENATSSTDERSVADKLAALHGELGGTLYDRLTRENALDLELYEQVRATYPDAT